MNKTTSNDEKVTEIITISEADIEELEAKTAPGIGLNHNETLVRDRAKGLKVKTRLKSGGVAFNHNETLVRDAAN